MAERIKTFQNILFATDLSQESAQAISWIRWFRCHHGASIHVLHVLDQPPVGLSDDEVAKQKKQADQRVRRFVQAHHLTEKGIAPVLLVGDISVLVEKFVTNNDIDLVVLGSRSTGLDRLFLGSMSEEIFRSVDCPALIVGPKVTSRASTTGLKRLLFATNLSKEARSGLKHLEPVLRACRSAELTLAHFVPGENKSVVERYNTRKRLRAELIELVPSALRNQVADIVVESGSPAKGIVEFAREQRADLIVLCVRSGGPYLRAATHGRPSITHEIIRSATCPVLTIRA